MKKRKKNILNYIFLSLVLTLINCTKIYDGNDVTRIKDLTYLKEDLSLITGKVRQYHNDTLVMEINYKKGMKDGLEQFWYKNGQLSKQVNYVKNKANGTATRWYSNGQINYKGNYKHGQEHGTHTIYGKKGTVIGEFTFKEGEKIRSTFELKPFNKESITSIKVNKSMEFTNSGLKFRMLWDKKLSYSDNLGYLGGIKSMNIIRRDETINKITSIEDKVGLGEIILTFYDYNFDGYDDFTIPIECGKTCWNKYYLYNPKLEKFQHKPEWDYIKVKQIDKLNKWIQSEPDGNSDYGKSKLYKINGLNLYEIESD